MNFWQSLGKPILALAPMAGYTDSAFRLICRASGADVVYSEMISVDGICYKNKKTLDMLKFNKKECPLVFQLFGSDPQKFADAIKIINKKLQVTNYKLQVVGIDLNFGCPAHKVVKNGAGSALMNDPIKVYAIIKTVCDNTTLPVSIKIRTQVKNVTALDLIKKIKSLPFSAIMIHGRTLNQGFNGTIDFAMLKKIKQLLPDKIVLANGGINTVADAQQILTETKADGLGIARGALGNPWLFTSIKQKDKKTKKQTITNLLKNRLIIKHAKLFLKDNSNLIPLRKHLVHYFKAQKNASLIRQQLIKVETLNDLKNILNNNKN